MVGSVKLPVSVLDPKAGYRPFAHAVGNFSECRSASLTLLQKGKGLFLYLVEFYIFFFSPFLFFWPSSAVLPFSSCSFAEFSREQ